MGMLIRELHSQDHDAVRQMLIACGAFTDEEIQVALEMMEAGLVDGLRGEYPHFVAEVNHSVCGYACVGKTPLTASTWHLYWICVHPAVQGRGVGQELLSRVEAFVRTRSGERLVVETSGQPSYGRTRRFYQEAGYSEVGCIPDFYKPGDDCVLYCKTLTVRDH
jgi:ribosomal protein S18 acetylase RimI-like enzyme